MATPVYLNGFGGTVTFGSFVWNVVEWSMKAENGLIDVTNVGSSNWGQFISGMNQGTVSMKGFWDTANVLTGASANIVPGQSGTATLKIGNSVQQVSCSVVIMSIDLTNSPTAGVGFNAEAKITTAPTLPT